ncbi:hypothetical protein [Streptomyces sp. NBC_00286]|uniref:hypothetical protein n=1 Tax=Streptomyces sp. NBC_00286 TaxID=2975701 RepID=UPI002E2CC46D|nr:hypothetical protein [Streptomyces sp. NBC_00286]
MLADPAPEGSPVPPDPAPGGPQRPYEPDVPGPRNIDGLAGEVTSDGGTSGKGVLVGFDRTSRAEPEGPPAAARRFVFLFDEALGFRPDAFPTCARATVESGGVDACPADSLVGRGTSHLYPEGTAEVYAVNTRHPNGMRGALVVIPANNTILELTWEPVTAPYRHLGYRWALDEIIPPSPTPPEQRVGTRRFELTWGATRRVGDRTVSFAETKAKQGDELRFGLWSEFVTGQVALPQATATTAPY